MNFSLTLRQLQIFVAIVEAGSTSAAADTLALSQSATSAALHELERALGTRVFQRRGKRLLLNEQGRQLLSQARVLLDHASEIDRWAKYGIGRIGDLRIGASTTIGNYLLPQLLAGFKRQLAQEGQTEWSAQVSIANTRAIANQVANFELDLALVEGWCEQNELHVEPWLEDELLLVASPDDPEVQAASAQFSLDQLKAATWLLRESGSGTRETILHAISPWLHQVNVGIEFGDSEAIKRAVSEQLGISCLSPWVVEEMLSAGKLVQLRSPLPPIRRHFYLITHLEKHNTPSLQRMIGFLRQYADPTRE